MTHDVFGKLKYRERDEQWHGHAPLARFAAVGRRAPEPPLTDEDVEKQIADMNLALEDMKKLMVERFGERIADAFADVDRAAADEMALAEEADEPPDPREEERERKRAEREERRAARLAKGQFPMHIVTPSGEEPTPQQAAAFRFLTDNEPAVFDAVQAQVWDSFRNAYDQEHWRRIAGIKPAAAVEDLAGRFALTRLDVTHESRGGFAHLVFNVDSDWQDEHGLMVVYSPDTREATWTSYDGVFELTEPDDPAEEGAEYVPTPHGELLEAILTGDDARARQLVAAGADVNALDPDEYPPLWIAVENMEVEEVRRLLAYGADPTLANPDENTTPLRHAKKLYREMGFAPSKKRDGVVDAMMALAREAMGEQYEVLKRRIEEIIRLLEGAGKS
jgi:hypothetical protein